MKRLFALLIIVSAISLSARAASEVEIRSQLAQLADGDWLMQSQALHRLADARAKSAVPAISQLVADDKATPYLRVRALVALARIDAVSAAKDAQILTASSEPQLRAAAAEALGYHPASAKAHLEKLRQDKDPQVAVAALLAWAKVTGEAAWSVVDPETKPLADQEISEDTKKTLGWKLGPAVQALAHVGTPAAHARINAIFAVHGRHHSETLLRALVTSGEPSVLPPTLRNLLAMSPNHPVHQGVMAAIRAQGPEVIDATFRKLLESTDPPDLLVACRIAEHLTPSPKTGDLLVKTCGDAKDVSLEHDCVRALMTPAMKPSRYAAHFKKILKSKHAPSRLAAVEALALCPEINRFEVYATIVENDKDRLVRNRTFELLRKAPLSDLPTGGIAAYLKTPLATGDSDLRGKVAELFRQLATKADYESVVKDWDKLINSDDTALRQAARNAIAPIVPNEDRLTFAADDGYLTHYQVVGTFIGSDKLEKVPAYPPESGLDFKKKYQAEYLWEAKDKKSRQVEWLAGSIATIDGWLRINHYVTPPTKGTVAYAAATLNATAAGAATIEIEATADVALWLNDKSLADKTKKTAPHPHDRGQWPLGSPDGTKLTGEVILNAGNNHLLIKTLNGPRAPTWGLRVRVTDADGKPLEVQP